MELSALREPFPGASIGLDDLGTEDSLNSWLAEHRYRINDRWGIVAGAYKFEADGDRLVSRGFDYEGVEFEASAALATDSEIDTYIFDVMRAAYRSDRSKILIGGGLHMFDLSASLTARAFVGGSEASFAAVADDVLAPLPNLNAQGFYAFTPRLAATATLGRLSGNVDDDEGSFLFLHARLWYRFQSGFGISAGYQFTDIDLEKEKPNGKKYEIEFEGSTVQLSYAF